MNARLRRGGSGEVKSRLGLLVVAALAMSALAAAASGALAAGDAAHRTDACPAGSKRAVIGGKVKCLRAGQRCKPRYQAVYRRAGFTCANGRLHKRAAAPPPVQPPPTEPPPTQPPPAPPAQPGHYHGLTSQLTTVDLDVSADGRGATNISTGQINQGCTPPAHISGGGIQGASRPIANDGTFVVNFDFQGSFSDGTPYSGNLNMTGHFSGSSVSGTLAATLNFTDNGTAYACGSGQQTWTAMRTG